VVNTLQPLAEGVEIRRSLVVRDARRLEGDERIQRHESVEPEDSVLDRRENGLERRMDARGAKRVAVAAGGHDLLTAFGTQLVREVSDPAVVAVFRLAIAEAIQAPEVARTLDSIGRETSRAALRHIMSESRAAGLIDGRPADLAARFFGLLWRDLMINLLLGVAERPNIRAIEARARDAATAFLRLHPKP
jgi:hypothetical protein